MEQPKNRLFNMEILSMILNFWYYLFTLFIYTTFDISKRHVGSGSALLLSLVAKESAPHLIFDEAPPFNELCHAVSSLDTTYYWHSLEHSSVSSHNPSIDKKLVPNPNSLRANLLAFREDAPYYFINGSFTSPMWDRGNCLFHYY